MPLRPEPTPGPSKEGSFVGPFNFHYKDLRLVPLLGGVRGGLYRMGTNTEILSYTQRNVSGSSKKYAFLSSRSLRPSVQIL